jgi:hypothetical protein
LERLEAFGFESCEINTDTAFLDEALFSMLAQDSLS